jgi:hypothetical protein
LIGLIGLIGLGHQPPGAQALNHARQPLLTAARSSW